MRVLIDECLPKKLKHEVSADLIRTVPEMGWASTKNGLLMRLAETEFDVILTNDQNLEYQQNLKLLNLAVVVLVARTNDIIDMRPLMPAANEALKKIRAGDVVYIKAPAS